MLILLKVVVGLVAGAFTFLLPLPMGAEDLFGLIGRGLVFLGIIVGLWVYLLKGKRWVSDQFKKKPSLAMWYVLVTAAAFASYILPWYFVQSPGVLCIALEAIAYSVFSFLASLSLTVLGAMFVDKFAK